MNNDLWIAVAVTISVACMILCIFNANDIKRNNKKFSEAIQTMFDAQHLDAQQIKLFKSDFLDVKKVYGDRLDIQRKDIDQIEINQTELTAFTTAQIAHNQKVIELINKMSQLNENS